MEVDDTLASCRSRFDLPENAVLAFLQNGRAGGEPAHHLLERRGSETRREWGSRDRRRWGREGSRRETTARVFVGVRVWCCETVRKGAEENNNQVFFTIGQAEVPARHVDVGLDFRLR